MLILFQKQKNEKPLRTYCNRWIWNRKSSTPYIQTSITIFDLCISYICVSHNRLPTSSLHMKSPFQTIHHIDLNLTHLHSFRCLCFLWLRPCISNKLQPRSQPCIFIGYADTQYAYLCLDPATHKIYTPRYVKLYDHIFPYNTKQTPPLVHTTDTLVEHKWWIWSSIEKWNLVFCSSTKNTNIMGCKWLFCIKRQADGTISWYKAHLVAKVFTQCPSINFHETFAPVVCPQTINIIFTIALGHKWKMQQLDVNNAFLLGYLQEQVYMSHSLSLKDSNTLITCVDYTKPFMV